MRKDQGPPATRLMVLIVLCCVPHATQAAPVPAFPGAEGFGASAVGGRGGRVIEVVNLNDRGPGSFRAACEASGPRIVVFRIGGSITLTKGVRIASPNITIAGQTAPGGGITLKGSAKLGGAVLSIKTHDVIVRYIRVRYGFPKDNVDGMSVVGAYNLIEDHCSFSWSTDEVSSIKRSHHVTMQWCIISEGLNVTGHSMGSLLTRNRDISLHHNLYAHNSERNPKMGGDPDWSDQDARFDFVNNVIYNWRSYATAVTGSAKANVVANYFKTGANSTTYPRRREIMMWQHKPGRYCYAKGNVGPRTAKGSAPDSDYEAEMVSDISGRLKTKPASHQPVPVPPVTTTSATKAYEQVLAKVGCSFPMRDAVDERIVKDVLGGTGKIINLPEDVGGWPDIPAGKPPQDTDHDGMPDAWELAHGLNPGDPNDSRADRDGDGYTNIEEYINGLVSETPQRKAGKDRPSARKSAQSRRPKRDRKALAAANQRVQEAARRGRDVLVRRIVSRVRAGQREQVYVALGGSIQRGTILAATEKNLVVLLQGSEVAIPWPTISLARFARIAAKYVGEEPDMRLRLVALYAAAGERKKAAAVLYKVGETRGEWRQLVQSIRELLASER